MRPPYCVVQIFPSDWRVSLTTELRKHVFNVSSRRPVATKRRRLNTCLFKFGVKDTRQSSGKSRTTQYGGLIFSTLCGCRE